MTHDTIIKLYKFIAKIVSLLEIELEALENTKYKGAVMVKKNITETLNKLVHLIIQLNKVRQDCYLQDDIIMKEEDELIIKEYLHKYTQEYSNGLSQEVVTSNIKK